jgi:4'-phosphopantetheinyl transferase
VIAEAKDTLLLALEPGSIHLWYIELKAEVAMTNSLSVLDTAELVRAEKLTPSNKNSFVEARGHLRNLLALYIQESPEQIRLNTHRHGKPYLVDYPDIVFNLSHSNNQMVIAVSTNCQLGVDIEICKPRNNFSALVKKCFADEESLYWNNLTEIEKPLRFYEFWTKKEAFVKATGIGIALGLKDCVVNPKDQETLLRIPIEFGTPLEWKIRNIQLMPAYCCAIATNKLNNFIKVLNLDNLYDY